LLDEQLLTKAKIVVGRAQPVRRCQPVASRKPAVPLPSCQSGHRRNNQPPKRQHHNQQQPESGTGARRRNMVFITCFSPRISSIEEHSNCRRDQSIFPALATTQRATTGQGISATITAQAGFFAIQFIQPRKKGAPPVSTMPSSDNVRCRSGGTCSEPLFKRCWDNLRRTLAEL